MQSSEWVQTPVGARGDRFAWVKQDGVQALLIEQNGQVKRYEPVSEDWYELLYTNAGREESFDTVFNMATLTFNRDPDTTTVLLEAIGLGAQVIDDFAGPPEGVGETYERLVCGAAAVIDDDFTATGVVRSCLPVALRAHGLDEAISWAGVLEHDQIGRGEWYTVFPDGMEERMVTAAREAGREDITCTTETSRVN